MEIRGDGMEIRELDGEEGGRLENGGAGMKGREGGWQEGRRMEMRGAGIELGKEISPTALSAILLRAEGKGGYFRRQILVLREGEAFC